MERQYLIAMYSQATYWRLPHSIVTLDSIGNTTKVDDETAIKTLKSAWDDVGDEFREKYAIYAIALYTKGRFSRCVYCLGKDEIDQMRNDEED